MSVYDSLECPESSVIRQHNDRLLGTIAEDFSYFSSKFQEKAFVSRGVIRELSSMSGVGNRATANRLLNCALDNLSIATDKWFLEFVGLFSAEAAYKELATIMMKAYKKQQPVRNQVALKAEESEAAILKTEEVASGLQEMFLSLLTRIECEFSREERGSKKGEFLNQFKKLLTNLPLFMRDQTFRFLQHEIDCISKASNVHEIFDILRPYWNYADYDFLHHILRELGMTELQKEMKRYIAALEKFEEKTSMHNCSATSESVVKAWIPAYFKTVTIPLDKDPRKFTLYEVRQLKSDILSRSNLCQYAMLRVDIPTNLAVPNSIKIHFAFPPEAFKELYRVLNDPYLQVLHKIMCAMFDDISRRVRKDFDIAVQDIARKRCPDGHEIKNEDKSALYEALKVSPSRTSDGYHYQCSCRADYTISISKLQDSEALVPAVSAEITQPMVRAPCAAVVGALPSALVGAFIAVVVTLIYECLDPSRSAYWKVRMLKRTVTNAFMFGVVLGAAAGAFVGGVVGTIRGQAGGEAWEEPGVGLWAELCIWSQSWCAIWSWGWKCNCSTGWTDHVWKHNTTLL